jgi:GAF domain-containing protein
MNVTSMLIIDGQSDLFTLRTALQRRYGIKVEHAVDALLGLELLRDGSPDCILVNPQGMAAQVGALFSELSHMEKHTPVILAGDDPDTRDLLGVYTHVVGHVPLPYDEQDLLPLLERERPSMRNRARGGLALAERASLLQVNQALERRVQEAMTLCQIGKAVAASTDLDRILTRIVEAAVFLLHAEESSIMLRDPASNELHLRAQKGLGEQHARGFNLKVQDTLIGSVVRTGEPVRMARDAVADQRLKVVTGYMVNALLYVPLALRGELIGVLGVANQTAERAFDRHDQRLLEALADYAALAIEIARQHHAIQALRQDLAGAGTIRAAVEELRQGIESDDPQLIAALERIESAAGALLRGAEKEAPTDV